VDTKGFWELDVTLGIRVNQYKIKQPIESQSKNNRLNFWNSTKTVFYLAFFDSFGCDSSLILFIPSKLSKNVQKQFTPFCLRPTILIIVIKR